MSLSVVILLLTGSAAAEAASYIYSGAPGAGRGRIRVEGGKRYLEYDNDPSKPGGEWVEVESYDAPEWYEAEREAVDVEECVTDPACGTSVSPGFSGGTPGEQEGAQQIATKLREAGSETGKDLPEDAAEAIDGGELDIGALAPGALASSFGVVALGAGAFLLGVEIGNELKQLWEVPETTLSEGETTTLHSHSCSVGYEPHSWRTSYVEESVEAGTYVSCEGSRILALSFEGKPGCTGAEYTTNPGISFPEKSVKDSACYDSEGHLIIGEGKVMQVPSSCDLESGVKQWVEGERVVCPPLGVPESAPLSSGQVSTDEVHGEPQTAPGFATTPLAAPTATQRLAVTIGVMSEPTVHTRVAEHFNPKEAAEERHASEETHEKELNGTGSTGVGPPTLPGFNVPHFGVACHNFPFGVPCWLIGTISSWSATGEAPAWEVPIDHKKLKVSLSALEPVMEVARPILVVLATVGMIFMFYKFATGGGPGGGED